MKLSGRILLDAIHFCLEKDEVKKNLGPIDFDPNNTAYQLISKINDVQENKVLIEIKFDYISINQAPKPNDIIVQIIWFGKEIGFVLEHIDLINEI
jgi:hypothetical protein